MTVEPDYFYYLRASVGRRIDRREGKTRLDRMSPASFFKIYQRSDGWFILVREDQPERNYPDLDTAIAAAVMRLDT